MCPEEMLADVGAGFDSVLLIVAVERVRHARDQQPFVVVREQRIPVVAPDDLDDVPAGAAKRRFELLDDLAVAAHWAIEPLQIAIDDEDQIVELLACRQRDRSEALRLIHLAVAEKRPNATIGGRRRDPRACR